MDQFLSQFALQFGKSVPLFALIGVGFVLSRWGGFPKAASDALSKFAFNVALSALLFRILSQMHKNPNTADMRLLVAFFGACFVVFFLGRLFSKKSFALDNVGAAVFGTGCVFSNNGLLGLPLAIVMLGDKVVPSVAAVLSMNALVLWTLASIVVELGRRTGALSVSSFLKTVINVLKNPLILSIVAGSLFNLTGLDLPYMIDEPIRLLGQSATPLSLVVVGMGLAEYGIGKGIFVGSILSAIKLGIQPFAVFAAARLIGLGPVETLAVTFLGSLPCGVNVYLMARQFKAIEGEVANAMLVSTLAASVTVPLAVTVLNSYLGF